MTERPRFLILGASILQIPLILRAKDMGFEVGVVDMDPKAPGAELADHFFCVSTNAIDDVLQLAHEFSPAGIATMATDMPMRTVAKVAHALDLPGPYEESVRVSTDKVLMAEVLTAGNVPMPWFTVITKDDFESNPISVAAEDFPVIVKPSDSSGSRGVSLVHTQADLTGAVKRAFGFGSGTSVLVEEYLDGPEVSVEVLCFDGHARVIAVTDKTTTGDPYFVEMAHRQPSQLPRDTLVAVEQLAIATCETLAFNNCAGHVEIRATSSGPKVIEVGSRLGGDFITSHLTPISTGTDMISALIDISIGKPPQIEQSVENAGMVLFLDATAARDTTTAVLAGIQSLECVVDVQVYASGSDTIESGSDRSGHIILSGKSTDEIDIAIQNIVMLLPSLSGIIVDTITT